MAQRETPRDPQDTDFIIQTARANKINARRLSEDELQLLDDVMGKLSQRQREVYTMVKGFGYSTAYAAELLIISENSAKLHLRRAKVKIAKALNDKLLQMTMFAG